MSVAKKVGGKRNHLPDSVVSCSLPDCNIRRCQLWNAIFHTDYFVVSKYIVPVLFALSKLSGVNEGIN